MEVTPHPDLFLSRTHTHTHTLTLARTHALTHTHTHTHTQESRHRPPRLHANAVGATNGRSFTIGKNQNRDVSHRIRDGL